METTNKLHDFVYSYPTRSKYGFHLDEKNELLSMFPDINMEKYNNALCGITGKLDHEGFIIYHCDILNALKCGIGNRDLTEIEWD